MNTKPPKNTGGSSIANDLVMCSIQQAADHMGISRQRARFLEKKALAKIRRLAVEDPVIREAIEGLGQ